MRRAQVLRVLSLLVAACDVEGDGVIETDEREATTCTTATDAYSPFGTSWKPSGPVSAYPWPVENFESYGPTLPVEVECGGTKWRQSDLEVTAGCLDAVWAGGHERGRIEVTSGGGFRALALGGTGSQRPVKWTDQAIEYRFFYTAKTGTAWDPGFKAFARYRTEDDLYVASWRLDGVVQIQRKRCGAYTTLATRSNYGAPKPSVWHKIRFEAIGNQLALYLDSELVLTATSGTFTWGTAGIRIDSADGAYIDDWRML
jgi:hypothetical protein